MLSHPANLEETKLARKETNKTRQEGNLERSVGSVLPKSFLSCVLTKLKKCIAPSANKTSQQFHNCIAVVRSQGEKEKKTRKEIYRKMFGDIYDRNQPVHGQGVGWGSGVEPEAEARLGPTCYPTTNGGMQNGGSVRISTHRIQVFARLAPICLLSRCLYYNKISASELSRKFIKGTLLVGYYYYCHWNLFLPSSPALLMVLPSCY